MKLKFFALIYLFYFINPSYAQQTPFGKISGKILDKDNSRPIVNAEIKITKINKRVVSDSSGYYSIDSIESGIYLINLSKEGYDNLEQSDIIVAAGKNTTYDFALQTSLLALKGGSVKSSKYENNRNMPVSAYSFSREEISLNPGAQGDIFRAIGMLPGVSSSGGIYSAIAVRGQGVRDNVYMVDDIPLTEVGHLEGNSFFNDPNGGRFSIFAPRVIDNAQFQGGGFGSEYGRRSASYLGLEIKEGNKNNAIVDGQIDLLGLNLNYSGPIKGLKKTTVFASARYQNFYALVNLIGLKDIGLPIYADVIVKTTTQINAKNKLTFIAINSPEHYVRDINNVKADKNLNLLYLPDFRRNKIVLGLNLKTLVGKRNTWKNILYYNSYTSDVTVGKAFPSLDSAGNLTNTNIPFNKNIQSQNYKESKLGYRSIYTLKFNKYNKLTCGFEMDLLSLYNDRQLSVNDTNFVFRASDLTNPTQKYQVIYPAFVNATFNSTKLNSSVFLQYGFSIGKRISLNTGFRYDYTGFSKQHVIAPRISGSYAINEKNSLNFGGGIYYQDPVYSDIADQSNNNTLKMEKTIQAIIGYKKYFRPDVKLTIEAWYKDFDQLVVTPVNGTVGKNNNGTGIGKGFDINITKRLIDKIHGQIGYSFIETKRNDNDGFGNYNFAFSQPHQINCLLSYKLNKKWNMAVKYRYATGKPKDTYIIYSNVLNNPDYIRYSKEIVGKNASRLPDFSSLDVRVNYNFNYKKIKMTGFVDIVNILNKQIANGESFNSIQGKNYYDGLAIFPSGGLKFEF